MLDNNGNMGILSPEGGVFDVISGMYSGKVTNLNIFLSGYDGEPVKINRKSGSVTLSHLLLTFGICAQPQVLNNVITNPIFSGKGLSQCFLFCQPESMIGRRKLVQSYNGNGAARIAAAGISGLTCVFQRQNPCSFSAPRAMRLSGTAGEC